MMTRSLSGRIGALALAAVLVAGCEAQPLGFFDRA